MANKKTEDTLASIARAAADAAPVPDFTEDAGDPGGDTFDVVDLGPTCPVQPLGFFGQRNYFLDFAGQLIDLGTEMRKGEVMQLFGTKMGWLEKRWATGKLVRDKDTGVEEFKITGFDQKEAQKGLIGACARQGLFNPTGKVRGRGAHLGDHGELFLHCGNGIAAAGRKGVRGQDLTISWSRPGYVGGYVYPTGDALERPADAAAPTHIAEQLLTELESWNWKRGPIDAYLLLCWTSAAFVCGALKWRPHAWITGPSGAGKSTLQRLLAAVMSDWAIRTEDATEAGVRQTLDQDALAVCFDEIEPDEGDSGAHTKIIKLARLASSGGSALRGSQDHKSKQFQAKSCFLFSSIHHHELPAQDRNRITILNLSAFPSGTPSRALPATLHAWGSQLRRRILEQWPRFDATLLAYQREMARTGYSGREQDQYGTLLACGDMLLHDAAPIEDLADDDRVRAKVAQLVALLDDSRSDGESTEDRCLKWLTGKRLQAASGQTQETIGEWIGRAVVQAIGGREPVAQDKLKTHGLFITGFKPDHDKDNGQGGFLPAHAGNWSELYLVVANKSHPGMREIFDASPWKLGVWTQALTLVPGTVTNKKSRFGSGGTYQCVAVPLTEVVDLNELYQRAMRENAAS